MTDQHRGNPQPLHPHLEGPVGGQQRDVRFAVDELLLALVLVIRGGLGVAGLRVAEFADHAPQHRVAAQLDVTAQMDPHLGAVVAPQHGAVVDQRHASAPFAGGTHRGAHARNASADHHEVELLLAGSLPPGELPAELRKRSGFGRRHVVGAVRQVDGVTTTVETRQILQRQGRLPGAERNLAGTLPLPAGARLTERC